MGGACVLCHCSAYNNLGKHLNNTQAYATWSVMQPTSVPQLYLYSKVDPIIPVDDVCKHISAQRARGVQCIDVDFEDSPHCEHYKLFPDKYIKTIKECILHDDKV